MTTLIKFTQKYGSYNGSDIAGFPNSLAAQLVADSVAVLYDAGSGSGNVVPAGFARGIGEAELPSAFEAAGGAADTTPSAAVQGFLGGDNVTIVAGHARPNSEPWA